MQEAIVRFLSEHGSLAQPEALAYLSGLQDPVGALKRGVGRAGEVPFILTLDEARRLTGAGPAPPSRANTRERTLPSEPDDRPRPRPARAGRSAVEPSRGSVPVNPNPTGQAIQARRVAPETDAPRTVAGRVAPEPIIQGDITGESTCEGTMADMTKLFRDRFNRMRRLYRKRREMVGATTLDRMNRNGHEVKFLAIVNEVRTTKNNHRLIEVEDETGQQPVLVPKSDQRLIDVADGILPDEVLGIIGRVSSRGPRDDGLVIADEIVRPEVPIEHEGRWGNPGGAVFVSDVHLGSDTFLADQWQSFIDWLSGKRSEGRELAEDVRWLVINGDLVEGVGIYPGQEHHLEIPDVVDQYRVAAKQLEQLPDHIRVIILPGNHDAVRPAEPQPAFPQEILDAFGDNVTCVGNPCWLVLDGVKVLAYHGVSLFDYFQHLPGADINHPLETMREMLIRRHLCPIYGGKTPLAPEHRDHMIIDDVPDVFVTGHVHAADVAEYRGVTLVNSSAWQSQTDYQKMLGFEPDPCKAFHVDLATGISTVLDFAAAPDQGDPEVANARRRLAV